MTQVRWVLAPDPGERATALAAKLGLSETMAAILARRLPEATVEAARVFLAPSLGDLHEPWLLPDMKAAAARIATAVRERQRVFVYGDYDTDGVTATAVLVRIFQALGCSADHYLPCRLESGYGISDDFVEMAIESGVDLVVTVDTGTSEVEKIRRLMEGGVDVIVTDHHEPGEEALPPALAVVNPKRADSDYPFRELTGAGVAFKLAWAVCQEVVGKPKVGDELQKTLLSVLPVVATGTIADVAPLLGENRILVAHGMQAFGRYSHGLRALLDVAGVRSGVLTARDVAWTIAPRLNAAGRMGDAELALRLLLEDEPAAARTLAEELNAHNVSRQDLCRTMLAEALEEVERVHDLDRDSAIVVAREGWHEGVIGIVAGRLCDRYYRPALVVAIDPETGRGKGSARSIDGLNLYEAMSRCRSRFLTFGGHEQAAGFTIMADQVEPLRGELSELCAAQIRDRGIASVQDIDAELPLGRVSEALARELDRLAPFGQDNPSPVFMARNIRVVGEPRLTRNERHFFFNASQNGVAHRAFVYGRTDWLKEMDGGRRTWDLAFQVRMNTFWSPPRLELSVCDMRPAG